jgi:hypothetical protein
MRWPRANLEEKQEPRAATSASAERHAEGMWHDVTRKGLDRGRDREADIRLYLVSATKGPFNLVIEFDLEVYMNGMHK